jgi:hypothetical protein
MPPDPELPLYANRPLTPRQDRIEAAIAHELRSGGTRSALREAVHRYADHARMQQVPLERAIAMVTAVAARSLPMVDDAAAAVGESPADRLESIVRWFTARYYRVD